MRKKIISLMLAVLTLCSVVMPALTQQTAFAAGKTAYVSKMEIFLDGEQVYPSGYLISTGSSAYTYFKLRDIAYLMRDKDCKFSVDYDKETNTIIATRGETYVGDGTELEPVGVGDQIATAATLPILVDGEQVTMDAYTVKGFTYYKLRDIGETFGFEVDYRNDSKQGIMNTPGYVEPEPEPEPEPETPDDTETDDDTNTTPDPSVPEQPDTEPEPEKSHIDGQLTVLIDVGHGGSDSGSTGIAPNDYVNYKGETVSAGSTIKEKDFNLPVALYLRDMLEASGVNVIMTAESDKYVSFSTRQEIIEANADTADLCFSVHHNAYNGNAAGFELLAQIQYENGGAGKELASLLEAEYYDNGRIRHRSTVFRHGQNGDYYAILRYAANVGMLAIISEYAFIDNSDDVKCVLSDDGLRAEAQAMHDAILEFFKTHPY